MANNDSITVSEVRVRNFRSLESVDVILDRRMTILIGENNVGKSNFIEAMRLAIGVGARFIVNEDDIYIAPNEDTIPRNREATIDILIRPIDEKEKILDVFSLDSFWTGHWGDAISHDALNKEFVGIRTRIFWSKEENRYKVDKKYLKDWKEDSKHIEESRNKTGQVKFEKIEPLGLYVLTSDRDIEIEMDRGNSAWYRMVSDLGVNEEETKQIEKLLSMIDNQIISASNVLSIIKNGLDDISKTINLESDGVSITSVPKKIKDLGNNLGINLAVKGSKSFPIKSHSSGTRSVASILIFRTFVMQKTKIDETHDYHTMLAVEEPESHLHPHAEHSLFETLLDISGQKIITTHSAHILSQADLQNIRYFFRNGPHTEVVQLNMDEFNEEDRLKVRRKILMTHGDILFSRAIVLYEGQETEDQVLPVFAREYWGKEHSSFGISMASVKGYSYDTFLKFANDFKIKWYLFSDGEDNVVAKVKKAVQKIGKPFPGDNVFIIPDNKNFEQYISSEEYRDALTNMIVSERGENDKHKIALQVEFSTAPLEHIAAELKEHRRMYGGCIAEYITRMQDETLKFPKVVRNLLEKISDDLGLQKR